MGVQGAAVVVVVVVVMCAAGTCATMISRTNPDWVSGCLEPPVVPHGYYSEVAGVWEGHYPVGAKLQFLCHTGYLLTGPDKFECNKGGWWSPSKQPSCEPSQQLARGSGLCAAPMQVEQRVQGLRCGLLTDQGAVHGTRVEYQCRPRPLLGPCLPYTLTCYHGHWQPGPLQPEWSGCVSPPSIRNGFVYDSNTISYPPQSQVFYRCEEGYRLEGMGSLTCEASGCWFPPLPPVCLPIRPHPGGGGVVDVHTLLVACVGSVVGVLLVILALILYQRAVSPKLVRLRNSGSGAELPPPPQQQQQQQHDPDREALIAFHDEVTQGVPPTYEEAIRHRPALVFEAGGRLSRAGRGHRVVVAGVRRSRGTDNHDALSYHSISSARHSSSTSRSMSLRSWSGCESLGSTDTVGVSDGGSSGDNHSTASQPPSCRALAGSLASFDTSSLVNNEGAPLLEEEMEGEEEGGVRGEDQYSLSTRDSDSLKDNISHTRSLTVSLQE